ncbi:DUF6248 family natural product biosynthesis protein (plasmid) [Streptomyces sp. Q6]|uniref:DUF6248 family natural product biosynthesis protein n=1 Tax=Streptomyces citrinus TaxID=3118173 RepID=A0ACD5ARH4_9ACTN
MHPVPNPSPMSEAEGAWVREHVWPRHLQDLDHKYPWGFVRWSTCERGTCRNCLASRCDLCVHRQKGGPHVDDNTDWLYNQHGRYIARHIPRPRGEICAWWCRCPCPKDGPLTPHTKPITHVPTNSTRRATNKNPATQADRPAPQNTLF